VGILIEVDGSRYVGEWKDGMPQGYGTQTFDNGNKFVGEFEDGFLHGEGIFIDKDGINCAGTFVKSEYQDKKR
tara:strand:+ start:151 stop:369 length:219 start_codon:yes stop_codon:yes gene_type:complete